MNAEPASAHPVPPSPGSSGEDSDPEPPASGLAWIDRRPPGSAASAIELDLAWLRRISRALAAQFPRGVAEVTVAILDDAEMDRLHREHCGVDGTTDVLTFPDPDAAPAGGLAGDLAIGVEVARREAAARGRRIEHEILLYAAHGLLHLSGERDDTAAAAERMREAQDRIMQALALPPTEEESARWR